MSGRLVREAVQARALSGRALDQDFAHPLHLIHLLAFHDGYHHGQIKLALKAAGIPLSDKEAGPLTWAVWRKRLPIPDRRSPARYSDLSWNGRNVGDIVARLTRGRVRADHRAHLDPDLRREARPRSAGWRPSLGQRGIAQGHLRKQGVGPGDVFLFWGLFRAVDDELRWAGPPEHHAWGWLQVDEVVAVDRAKTVQAARLAWASDHPHWNRDADPTNTLYVAGEDLSLPGLPARRGLGAGVFDATSPQRRLTRPDARGPSEWTLPIAFLPRGRRALSYHDAAERWTLAPSRGAVQLQVVGRGEEFVLNLDQYPEVVPWLGKLLGQA